MMKKHGPGTNLNEDIHPEFIGEKGIPFDEVFFKTFINTSEQFTLDRMHPSYGRYMVEHCRRVGFFQEQLLVAAGMDPEVARKVGLMMIPHDLGKTYSEQVPLYILTTEKPLKDAFAEQQRRLHAPLGPTMTNVVLQVMGTSRAELDPAKRIWLTLSDYQQKGHHKPLTDRMGLIQRAACVSDAIDGQLKTVSPIPIDELSTSNTITYRDKAIEKLFCAKYDGQYDRALLTKAKEINNALRLDISPPAGLEMPPIS